MKHAWHTLFAPLPDDAVVKRKPVASPELVAQGKADAIAGWQSLTVELSAGADGLRHIMVTLDESGTPISAGDWVMHASEGPQGTTYVHENVGGRLELDGSFRGTRWRSVTFGRPDSEEAELKESQHTPPSAEDVAAIHALVKELLGRAS